MEDKIIQYLEATYLEYLTYKKHFLDNYVKPEDRRKQFSDAKKIETTEQLAETVFNLDAKYSFYEFDLNTLLKKLYHTVLAYENLIEIPQEVRKEIDGYKHFQYYTHKNGEEIELMPERRLEEIKNLTEQLSKEPSN